MALQPRPGPTGGGRSDGPARAHGGPLLFAAVYFTGVYGRLLRRRPGRHADRPARIFLDDSLQRLNATKNVLAALVNGIAALLFVVLADVDWAAGRAPGRRGDHGRPGRRHPRPAHLPQGGCGW
ncbi:MAG: hypothetical protein WKG07_45890 [Hymenobacter sp.]